MIPLVKSVMTSDVVEHGIPPQFLTFLEATTDCVFILDRQWRFTYLNQRAVTEIGGGHNLAGASIWKAFPEAADSAVGSRYRQAMDEGSPVIFETYYPPLSAWYEIHAVPVENGLSVFFRNINDRKQAEQRTHEAHKLFQTVIDSVEDLIFVKDREGRFVFINQHIAGGTSLLGKRVEDLYAPELAEVYQKADEYVLETGDTSRVEEIILMNGEPRRFQTVKVPWRRDGEIIGIIGVSRDLTERVQAEELLRASERKLATLIDSLPGLVYVARPEAPWPITFLSDGAEALTGYKITDFSSGSINWADIVHPDDLEGLEQAVSQAHENRTLFSAVYRILTPWGEVRWVLDRGQFIFNEAGGAISLEGFVGDLTEQKQAEERIRWVAHHDVLTQLPNRALFNKRLDDVIGQTAETRSKVGVLFLDVDHLKRVNDTLGHDTGDALLVEVARRLQRSVGGRDTVSRIGGDEFAVILPGIDGEAELSAIAEGILSRLDEPFTYAGRSLDCRASIGASLWPRDESTVADLQKQADMALYAAKTTGRGKAMLFEPEMRADAQRRASMLNHARWAVEERRIEPFYQPKVILGTGRLAGFEALLRWRNPRGGLEGPSAIQAAFEEPRLAIPIGQQMQDGIICDMRQWLDAGLEFGHVAVNASAAEFRSGGYAEQLLERLRRAGIPTRHLEVEVTETVFLGRGAECVEQALRTLSAEGIRIALDDFGTGYASLSHLKQFPVHVIKIDRSFVQDLTSSPETSAILSSVLGLGRSLGMTTVAEGVETAAQAAFLEAHGCNQGQGYLFGKPASRNSVPSSVLSWEPHQSRTR
jgi:diguanylate cyclase (GGDEF)-like protein/PAS domain S-box-containing protein